MTFSNSAVDWMGYLAALCTTSSLLPQLIRTWRSKSARDISLGMFLFFSIGVALWIGYGFSTHSMPIIVANCVTIVFSLAILVLKLRYDGLSL